MIEQEYSNHLFFYETEQYVDHSQQSICGNTRTCSVLKITTYCMHVFIHTINWKKQDLLLPVPVYKVNYIKYVASVSTWRN